MGDVPTWFLLIAATAAAVPAYLQLRTQGRQLADQSTLVSKQIEQLGAEITERRQLDAAKVVIRPLAALPDSILSGFRVGASVENQGETAVYEPAVRFVSASKVEIPADQWTAASGVGWTQADRDVLYGDSVMEFNSSILSREETEVLFPIARFTDRFGRHWQRDHLDRLREIPPPREW